jgi:hypothetical protein
MAAELPSLRRIVTGVNASGKSVIIEDGPPPAVRKTVGRPGYQSRKIWATYSSPALIDEPDRSTEFLGLMPPVQGTSITYVDFPPESRDPESKARAAKEVLSRPAEPGLRWRPDGVHPGLHQTDTIDYAIVVSGEIYAVMEDGETLMKEGDVLIQRGTFHSWDNRSDRTCRLIFVMLGGKR